VRNSAVISAIVAAARARGVDPAYALAVAERESAFNPTARSSKTIAGIYQMRGDLRAKYGVGDSLDPSDQANGWINSLQDLRSGMRSTLGRDPSDPETYLGHHFGAQRAGRMLNMDPSTPVEAVFTPQEMSLNPHFARAGTVGRLNSSVMADIDARMARFGGAAQGTSNSEPADLSSLGELVLQADRPPEDLSSFGTPVHVAGDGYAPGKPGPEQQPDPQANFARNKKWAKPGNYRTELGDQEPAFQKWVKDNKVPFDVNKTGPDDYDMRGFWKGAQSGDPLASTAPNPNDGLIHYNDKWKTPYHKSFSSESQWAQPNAPTWNDKDQLIDPSNGGVVYDEKAPPRPSPSTTAPDLSSLGTLVQVANLEQPPTGSDPNMALEERKFSAPEPPQPTPQPARPAPAAPAPPDLSQYGTPVS
jgi:hypothetical protein